MFLKFLAKSYPTEKNLFLVPKTALRVIGLYPESGKSTLIHVWGFFNLAILGYGSYAEFAYGVHFLSIDIMQALDALCPVASSIMTFIKLCFVWWYRAPIERLIKRIAVLTAEQNSIQKLSYKQKYFSFGTRISFAALFFGFATATLYTFRAAVVNYLNRESSEDAHYETPFKMAFPQPFLKMPLFPLAFTVSHWHGYITVAGFAGVDGLYICCCMYFVTLFKALQKDITALLVEVKRDDYYLSTEVETEKSLIKIIERHNEIVDLIKTFSAVMSGIILGHFVTSTFIIGTSVIDMMLFPNYGIFLYLVHTISVVTQLFLYCLGGSMVINGSTELATSVYCSNWYTHNVRIQKMVLLILVRSQRSLVIKVPFFAPSLPVFNSILSSTGSLIALLKSVI